MFFFMRHISQSFMKLQLRVWFVRECDQKKFYRKVLIDLQRSNFQDATAEYFEGDETVTNEGQSDSARIENGEGPKEDIAMQLIANILTKVRNFFTIRSLFIPTALMFGVKKLFGVKK